MLNLKEEFISFLKKEGIYIKYRTDMLHITHWAYTSINYFFDVVDCTKYMVTNHISYERSGEGYDREYYNQMTTKSDEWLYFDALWLMWLIEHNYKINKCWSEIYQKIYRLSRYCVCDYRLYNLLNNNFNKVKLTLPDYQVKEIAKHMRTIHVRLPLEEI